MGGGRGRPVWGGGMSCAAPGPAMALDATGDRVVVVGGSKNALKKCDIIYEHPLTQQTIGSIYVWFS